MTTVSQSIGSSLSIFRLGIIEVKNKKMHNLVSFHFNINIMALKSTTYANLRKTAKMTKKKFIDALGLSK